MKDDKYVGSGRLGNTARYDEETKRDKCPVCKQHPEDLGYKFLSSGQVGMMCCEVCGVVYVPESIQKAMEDLKKKIEGSRIVKPDGLVPIGPKLKS
jgi:hypothetical protein